MKRVEKFGQSLVTAWYRWSTPDELPMTEPLWKREVVRRARIISLIMLVIICLTLFPLIFRPSPQIVLGLVVSFTIDLLALRIFNRQGKIVISGIIITCVTSGGILLELGGQIAMYRNIHLGFLPFFVLPILGIIVATSTLTFRNAFAFFLLNCFFVLGAILFVPFSADLLAYLRTPEGLNGLIEIPISSFIASFASMAIWINSANNALRRAGDIEVRAELARSVSQKYSRDIQDAKVALIHIDGDLEQDSVVHEDNVLFAVVQGVKQMLQEKRRLEHATDHLIASLRNHESLDCWLPTGTSIDAVVHFLRTQHTMGTEASLKTGCEEDYL